MDSKRSGGVSATEAFRCLAECPNIEAATITLGENQQPKYIDVTYSQKDARANKSRKTLQTFSAVSQSHPKLDGSEFSKQASFGYTACGRPVPLGKALTTIPSPSGKLFLSIFREEVNGKGSSGPTSFNYSFVISDHQQNLKTIRAFNRHKQISPAGSAGGVAWSRDEMKIAYIAEPKEDATKKAHFFADDAVGGNTSNNKAPGDHQMDSKEHGCQPEVGSAFEFAENWGEIMADLTSPKPFLIDIKEETILDFKGAPSNVSFGQPQFTPDGTAIVLVGFAESPRRLGLTYYNSRASKLYLAAVPASKDKAEEEKDGEGAKDDDAHNDTKQGDGDDKHNVSASKDADDGTDQSNKWIILTKDDHSAMNPRFSPDGTKLVYTTTDDVWYHNSCSRLRMMEWSNASSGQDSRGKPSSLSAARNATKPKTVVEIVHKPKSKHLFPGLWVFLLPARVWLSDSRHIVLHSLWHMQYKALCIDTATSEIQAFKGSANMHDLSSMTVLDVLGDYVLVKQSTPTTPSQLHLARVDLSSLSKDQKDGKDFGGIVGVVRSEWQCVVSSPSFRNQQIADILRSTCFRIFDIQVGSGDVSTGDYFQILVMGPKGYDSAAAGGGAGAADRKGRKIPLVLRPHGGPHSGFSTGFDWGNALMVCQGLCVVCVNYRGSIGYGMHLLSSLPGRCGIQDVQDCMASLQYCLKGGAGIQFDPSRVMVWGGSHGGFLTTHLIGQYPNTFYRAATRNPVTNCAFMVTETDIPDWCYVEAGLPSYSAGNTLTKQDICKLYEMSPVAHAKNIKTPLLILLGMKDLRVPPAQGLNFYRTLKARGVRTRCLTYPESTHSLSDSVRTEADVWINVVKWFQG